MTNGSRQAPPCASLMLESLRGLGYSPWSALADLIDNSVTAGATTVDILYEWAENSSWLAILDDGRGMSASELDSAMRLGASNPRAERADNDLGRFGLGLKTASLSQCRRLTVATRQGGVIDCLRWDLDVLRERPDDGWLLLEGPAAGSEQRIQPLDRVKHGTLVIWETLDRLATPGFSSQDFLDLLDRVEQHLSMVFHRYLEGPQPRLTIRIAGRAIAAWDPFFRTHSATYTSPTDSFRSAFGKIELQGFVLPHRDRIDAADFRNYGGPAGWTAQQGFYVYRNQRLLVSGSWLGLGLPRAWTKEQAHQLARIRVDIPNSADSAWKIDVRKSVARPPIEVRYRLSRLAEDVRDRARRVFVHRGSSARVPGEPVQPLWRAQRAGGAVRYGIDEGHPVVQAILTEVGELAPRVKILLRVLAETLPVQRIWFDTTEFLSAASHRPHAEPPDGIREVLPLLFDSLMKRRGITRAEAVETLLRTDPFNNYPELVRALNQSDAESEGIQ